MVTKIVLVGTLAATAIAVVDVLQRDELSPRTTAAFLALFSALFLLRVAGQVLLVVRAPRWLPPMEEWNLVPYRLLLPIQLVFLAAMAVILGGLSREEGPLGERRPGFGWFLVGLSVAYAASMAMRYAVRMRRRPGERWFGGAIPIVFHVVLAAFLLTWGRYHVSG